MSTRTPQSAGAESVLATRSGPWTLDFGLGTLSRFVRTKPLGAITGMIIMLVVLAAIFAPVLAPYDPTQTSLIDSLRAPSAEHPMGTDRNGRDLFSRIIY